MAGVGLRRLSTTGSGEIGAFVGHVPGDALLHPVSLASIALLLINDHLLKATWPGLITGKLSDFAGLVFFPLFLQGVVEVVSAALGRWRGPNERVLLMSVLATAAVFISIKTVPAANELVAQALGLAQSFVGQLMLSPAAPHSVSIALDARDLVALPMLAVPYLIGRGRLR